MSADGSNGMTAQVHETEPYRPSNGTEGEMFLARFCDRCEHDAAYRLGEGDSCQIVAATFAFHINHPDYPKEWVRDAGKPWLERNERCIAFRPVGDARVDDPRQGLLL